MVKMNVFDCLNKEYEEITNDYLKKLAKLDKATEAAQKLPQEIQNYNDCWYFSHWDFDNKFTMGFESEETINKLKMFGVQGFKAAFWGEYGDANRWVWTDGKLVYNGIKIDFFGGHPKKPAACIIEEYEEPAKPATKKLRAICTETGKEV